MNPTILSLHIARTYGRPLRGKPFMSLQAFIDGGGELQALKGAFKLPAEPMDYIKVLP